MPVGDLQERLERLSSLLDQTSTLLHQYGESHWTAWLATCKRELSTDDVSGLDRLLGGFGGMGSFNDLLVMRMNGHRIQQVQEEVVNGRLMALRREIWVEATTLRHDIRQAGK